MSRPKIDALSENDQNRNQTCSLNFCKKTKLGNGYVTVLGNVLLPPTIYLSRICEICSIKRGKTAVSQNFLQGFIMQKYTICALFAILACLAERSVSIKPILCQIVLKVNYKPHTPLES